MTKKTIILVAAAALAGCGDMPDTRCITDGRTAIVTRVSSEDVRGGRDWHVAFKDAKGVTRVCRAGNEAQALQPGDVIDGKGMWRE